MRRAAALLVAASACSSPDANVTSIAPDTGPNTIDVSVALTGTNIRRPVRSNVDTGKTGVQSVAVFVGDTPLTGVVMQDTQTITATVPAGLPVDTYDVTLELGGERLVLPRAYSVTDGSTTTMPDAGTTGTDAGVRDPTLVHVSYALGKDAVMYSFDSTTNTFTALPSTNCPPGEETAVFTDGRIFVTSADSSGIYAYNPTLGCIPILLAVSGTFPFALGTAPPGAIGANEMLVGYRNSDYYVIDPNGTFANFVPNALNGMLPDGDLTTIGYRAFLSVAAGTGICSSGGVCIVEIDLLTGAPKGNIIKQIPNRAANGLANGGGKLLLFENTSEVYSLDLSTNNIAGPLATYPQNAGFSGAGAPAY